MQRREVLRNLSLGIAALPLLRSDGHALDDSVGAWEGVFGPDIVNDEDLWRRFRRDFYTVSDEYINLENGYFGVSPIPVTQAYHRYIDRVARDSTRYLRGAFWDDFDVIVEALAAFTGAAPDEFIITRNATEAMNLLIHGLDLRRGDEVIVQTQDYPSMIEAFQMREQRDGIVVKSIEIPLIPQDDEDIVGRYRDAVTERTRCILVTDMLHGTGQILPTRKIAAMARPLGIEVIVDAAHSFAHVDYQIPDLGCDFVGVNLHKWFSAPLGTGLLYVKRGRAKDLRPMYGDVRRPLESLGKLAHFGTLATPILLCIPHAAQFNDMVTKLVKEQRLRYLQTYWTSRAAKFDRVEITTPASATRSCAISSFAVDGISAGDVAHSLSERFNVLTVRRDLGHKQVVRVTPNLYNQTSELDRLLEGIEAVARG